MALGRFGQLHLGQGRPRDARDCIDAGERLARELDARPELVELLCLRARLEAGEGRVELAEAALVQAENFPAEGAATPEGEVALGLARRAGAGTSS